MASQPVCSHLDHVLVTPPPQDAVEGCEECLQQGMQWVHLRVCLECGHIGCCDNSPGKHATQHFHDTSHPVIRSAQPGEEWSWCYVDEKMFVLRFD
jgi:uncharacterized UBP type Zn finger protein